MIYFFVFIKNVLPLPETNISGIMSDLGIPLKNPVSVIP